MQLLCGDIGGTKTLLQRVRVEDGLIEVLAEQRFASGHYPRFDLILAEFLDTQSDRDAIGAACFGVAGPVIQTPDGETATITNLPWQMDSQDLAQAFQLPRVALINDLQAVGHGIEALPDSDFLTLQTGRPQARGNRLVIGAGTGLGLAQMVWSAEEYRVLATEAGHADFAPADAEQLKLVEYMIRRHGRCSVEFIVSGPGLGNIFAYLAERAGPEFAAQVQSVMQAPDRAAAIARAADEADGGPAREAVDLFMRAYGGQAGNFALACLPMGGVYIAGGIAAKNSHRLQAGGFIQAFNAKGKMAKLMQTIPVSVVTNAAVGLLGSRVYAQKISKD